ncbi:MAG: SAM-dependent methyltransferase, partial [Candidatus Levybacteria bacterium GW2011_GWC2_37_7]
NLLTLLAGLKTKGKTIAAYGAPAKGNTLLNYFSIGQDFLDFVVDDSPFKQGLYTPGKHIPVVSSKVLYEKKPDYLLILAWNFAESIMKMHERFKTEGGKFIIPVPKPRIE